MVNSNFIKGPFNQKGANGPPLDCDNSDQTTSEGAVNHSIATLKPYTDFENDLSEV